MEKRIHQIKCENCGSKIDPNKLYCEYCGAKLFLTGDKEEKQKMVLTDDMINAMLKTNSKKTPILPLVLFMIIWCSGAFFGSFMAFSSGAGFFGVVPFLMGVFGVVVLLSQIKASKLSNFEEVYELYDKKKYQKANEILEQKLKDTDNFEVKQAILIQLIILNYYKFHNLEKTQEHIFAIQTIGFNLPLSIQKIAKELQ